MQAGFEQAAAEAVEHVSENQDIPVPSVAGKVGKSIRSPTETGFSPVS